MTKEIEAQAGTGLPEIVPPQVSRFRRVHRRALILLGLAMALAAFLVWLPPGSRATLLRSILASKGLVAGLMIFCLLSLSLIWSFGERVDAKAFQYLNLRNYHPLWMDRIMWGLTQIGNMAFTVILAALSYELGDTRFAVLLVLGVLSLWLFVEAVKGLADRARPFKILEEARIVGWREPGKSFPSGHTSQAFFVMFLLAHHLQLAPQAAAVLYGLAAVVGLTRVYVGAHYPRDVLAGACLGLVWGILISQAPPYG